MRAILHVGKSWWGSHHVYSACEIQASPCHLKECCPHAYVRARSSWEPCLLKEERGQGWGYLESLFAEPEVGLVAQGSTVGWTLGSVYVLHHPLVSPPLDCATEIQDKSRLVSLLLYFQGSSSKVSGGLGSFS